jgi:hypothetical protein
MGDPLGSWRTQSRKGVIQRSESGEPAHQPVAAVDEPCADDEKRFERKYPVSYLQEEAKL